MVAATVVEAFGSVRILKLEIVPGIFHWLHYESYQVKLGHLPLSVPYEELPARP